MTINEITIQALKPLSIPVWPDESKAETDIYCVFNYDEVPGLFANNSPQVIIYNMMVHLFCPQGHNSIAMRKQIRTLLKQAGFSYALIDDVSDEDGQHWVFSCQYAGAAE